MVKKILACVCVVAMVTTWSSDIVLASSSETDILGSVSPTILNVSAPSSVFFSINPNAKEGEVSFASSNIEIVNNTNAPVEVRILKGHSNFTLKADSPWKPVNTSPDAHKWRELGVTESESYIALGIQADTGAWKRKLRTEPLYVKEHSSSNTDVVFGEILNNSAVNMSLVGYHGFAFISKKECAFRVVWSFSLSD